MKRKIHKGSWSRDMKAIRAAHRIHFYRIFGRSRKSRYKYLNN